MENERDLEGGLGRGGKLRGSGVEESDLGVERLRGKLRTSFKKFCGPSGWTRLWNFVERSS